MAFKKNLKKALGSVKKRLTPIFLCSIIVLSCWAVLFHHYTSRQNKNDFIAHMENALLDWRFLNRGIVKPKNKIGILAIDEKAIEQFGRWPFSRKYYGQALRNLKDMGVSWVGFDAVFSEAEKPTIDDVKSYLDPIMQHKGTQEELYGKIKKSMDGMAQFEQVAPGDKDLAEGIKYFQNAIMGYFYFRNPREVEESGRKAIAFEGLDNIQSSQIETMIFPEGRDLSSYDFLNVYGIVPNTPFLRKSGTHNAFFSNEADPDAIIRWVTLVKSVNGHLMPSLSLELAALSSNRTILVEFGSYGIESIDLVNNNDDSDSLKIPIDPLGMGRALINHRGPSETFPHFSLADAYNNTFTDKQKEWLKGSSLLVGMTAIGINDQRPNPFDATLDGVEIHATAADNILSKDLMSRPKSIYSTELLIIFLIGLIFSPILVFSRAAYSGLIGFGFILSYYFFDKHYWFDKGIWAYMAMPYIEIFLLFMGITLYKYITEEREKKKVRGAFSYYLSPEVIEEVLEEPENLQLGGTRKNLTVFFSDVRGFTTISESLNPEQLCAFMNDYFTPMTQIILKSKGVLDKYIGDAIMAFWGAPFPTTDHADRAVDAAIDMLTALEKLQFDFKKKGLPNVDMGMGLNTGPMSVGNMGSVERFCYTVMGDAVNLGSRIESLTKEYGLRLIVSEFTVAAFVRKHLYRDLDDIRVKGKNVPIKVYHVFKPDALPEKVMLDLIHTFEEARKFYRAQEWNLAKGKFDECLRIHPSDGPSKLYIERIEEFSSKPKIENWDGVYTFTHK